MLETKLILIEGLPGAGKSISTDHLGTVLQQHGITSRWFKEDDEPHPIPCLDFEIKGLTSKLVPLWLSFANIAIQEPIVTIIESRLWQNTALFMYMSECEIKDIIHLTQQVSQVLTQLSPVLLYLYQDNIEIALRRLYTTRGERWMEWALGITTEYQWFTSRGLKDFAGWVQFFEEWQQVSECLYNDWPFQKIKILNPHEDWVKAYEQMSAFLHVE
jgi:hypothetical protein